MVIEKVIGHRGAAAYAPENTLAAFDKALTLGCRFIEFDVMCSADSQPFVFHDESLKRTTNGSGDLGLVESAYIESLDAGSWFSPQFKGERVPHFKEVLKWLSFTDLQANIEIKPYPGTEEHTAAIVMSYIQRYWPQGKALPLVSSFSWDALLFCRSIAPEMPVGLLLNAWDEVGSQKARQLQCFSIHLGHKALTKAQVKEIKEQAYVLCAYTVNRKPLAKKLLSWGVDAVFSDYPDLLT